MFYSLILDAELTADKKINLRNERDLLIIEKFIHTYEKLNAEKQLLVNIKPTKNCNNDFFISDMELDIDLDIFIDIENSYEEKPTLRHCIIDINQTCEVLFFN